MFKNYISTNSRKIQKLATIIFVFSVFLSANLNAQIVFLLSKDSYSAEKKITKAINSCPGGVAFGIYSINYEQLFGNNHGLVCRFDYEDVPKNYTEAKLKAKGGALILNYRYHLSGEMESGYIGIYSRYRVYSGTGTLESTNFDFTIPEVTLGVNIGKRWVWDNGINLNLAFGYGFFLLKDQKTSPLIESTNSILDKFEDSYDFIDPFLGEFSIGYAF